MLYSVSVIVILLFSLYALLRSSVVQTYLTHHIVAYLSKELNITIYKEPVIKEFNGKKFFIGHGDGLGPGDKGYKFIKWVFGNPICQWLFARLHPDFGIGLARYWSGKSRVATENLKFQGEDKEAQIIYAKERLSKEHFDYFIFGHRHIPLDIKLNENSRFINLGDWIINNSYAVFDGNDIELKYYRQHQQSNQ